MLSKPRMSCSLFPAGVRVKATAPPRTETALSMPDGVPCSTFSDKKAQASMRSIACLLTVLVAETCLWAMRREEPTHALKAAEEPRPAPTGRFADTVSVTERLGSVHEGLRDNLRILARTGHDHVHVQPGDGTAEASAGGVALGDDVLDALQKRLVQVGRGFGAASTSGDRVPGKLADVPLALGLEVRRLDSDLAVVARREDAVAAEVEAGRDSGLFGEESLQWGFRWRGMQL